MSPFNAASITAFLAWFGGGGMVLHQLTAWTEAGIVAASLGSGIAGGSLVNRFLGLILTRERPLEATTLIGAIARVTSLIREGGTGEIVFVINGTRKVSAARADSGSEIDKGTEVVIVRMEKGIAYVSTWDELAATTSLA
jgi:membrane protein implicated in regulation of membrane protease activity